MRSRDVFIELVNEADKKAQIVKEVLFDLPKWFALPESTKDYIEQSKKLPLLVARNNKLILGFITLKETSEAVCEIHCMGVKEEHHRKGIGKKIYQAFEEVAKKKYEFVQVKTLDEGLCKEYDQTVAFYKKLGFKKMEVFPRLWDEQNPCLIMIKKI